ncbi:hypothetical protein PARMER_01121 [Parabacteroides merdae ATCC 43184]|nr:hypothetical protein PARMER_01121 [Parabacteroides merdae ATCC 43184]
MPKLLSGKRLTILHFRKTDNANISDRMTILLQKNFPITTRK